MSLLDPDYKVPIYFEDVYDVGIVNYIYRGMGPPTKTELGAIIKKKLDDNFYYWLDYFDRERFEKNNEFVKLVMSAFPSNLEAFSPAQCDIKREDNSYIFNIYNAAGHIMSIRIKKK